MIQMSIKEMMKIMTHSEFIDLYKSGGLDNVTVWTCDVKNRCGEVIGQSEMICCMYHNRYFIRISKLKGLSRLYHEELKNSYIREFDNRDSANRYFMNVKQSGYSRVSSA